ncbi:glycosyltransferase family 4 protein [Rathayibacter sp. VKM Ac-2835]|uniref:glycosyltransferase family 4 protein n=1 Tax=unclassified Rathayibacter TaxID=2609250 RepID=UPI000F4BEEDA|nr:MULTISPECIES: glycosyltransferase family 4 protein [unclassified Rathayibacter]NRG42354.1 glycosyltransferase family 4 protein [Rathayibacter sp. VKM Ac-2835]ROQ64763.1 glycosyltransferase involved in cell wall biosynthesis [Rathayibacter sp. PhB152]
MTTVRPRILHLGYEDPRKPGAGGGSVRTLEMNKRLADDFEIVVACARFAGCEPYEEDGVRYVHLGAGTGRDVAAATYFASQRRAVSRYAPDLVVEDFGAPISTWGLPRTTSVPVIGVVQWLFAAEKARQYHLPFDRLEQYGLAAHRTLIAVSDDLGARLRERNSRAAVHVVPNALPPQAFATPTLGRRRGIRYLGRLEDAQKGISLLLRAFASAARAGLQQDLLLAGEGPDRIALEALAADLGIADRIEFVGPVAHQDRFAWLAAAEIVAMPSRYETFGMVAAESMAVHSPVVAFDIDCLRNLVHDGTGRRVAAYDVEAYARALLELGADPELRSSLGRGGAADVASLTWDNAAEQQGDLYRAAVRDRVSAEASR